jgi:hypothetical protein
MKSPHYAMMLVCGVLGACATSSQDRFQSYKAEMDAYMACNLAASKKVAPQSGDPVSLAIAARGMCAQEDVAYMYALMRQHRPQLAVQIMDRARERMIEFNASIIVSVRARR